MQIHSNGDGNGNGKMEMEMEMEIETHRVAILETPTERTRENVESKRPNLLILN